MNNNSNNCGDCGTTCSECGRPWAICKQDGGCGCNKCKDIKFCEYGRMANGCIREKQPGCPMQAVIPSVTVESIEGIKSLADCLVHVSDINTTFYIDDKHRPIITWAGPIDIPGYDMEGNPNNYRDQIVTDVANQIAVIYDKSGNGYLFGLAENIDLQEQVNNKLDEMAEQGVLADIISQYLNSTAVFGYDTLADMKSADNLTNGSYARTLGYHSKNDNGGGLYKIRNITNDDVVDEAFIVEMGDGSNQLIAELIIENDEVNVKQCGAYGDNTHDDYQAFNKACNGYKNVLIPSGTYKLNTTVTLNQNTNIYGKTAIVCWSGNSGNTDKTEIVTTDVYAFTCSWGNVNNFENITFNGKGINQPCGARINKCEFKGTQGLNNVRVTTVSECSFHNCSVAGIVKLTDSFIQNCFFYNNEIAIDMEDSGDNTIIGNKIEWNTLGIKMHDTVYAVIADNTFDRQTTYAISGTNTTNITINGNNFERNLTMHILLSGGYITISNNGMFSKNSQDDQSGTVLPTVAMYLKSISNSLVKGNNVFLPAGDHTSKLFNAYPDYVSNVSIEGNILNGKNTDRFSVSMGTLTSSTTDPVTLAYDFSNVDYLGMTAWTTRLVLPRLVNNNITRSFTNMLFARITPNTGKIQFTLDADDTSKDYTCYADLEITNKFSITI